MKGKLEADENPLIADDWNFDNVPDKELVACCVWEYARESTFIRELRRRCLENWRAGGASDEKLSADLGKLSNIGCAVEIITRGFYFAPNDPHRIDNPNPNPITNSFPQPWQTLPADERAFRVRVGLYAGWTPAVPFECADWLDAKEIAERAEACRKEIFSDYHRVQRENPGASEVELIEQGKLQPFPGIPVSLLGEHGKEVTVVAINWAHFTNDKIANYFRRWIKLNRPREIPVPSNQGRKRISDRVKLERLAIMRLVHPFTLAELRTIRLDVWKRYNTPNRRWHKDVNKAHAHFRELFPFLSKDEFPRSWPPKDWPGQMK